MSRETKTYKIVTFSFQGDRCILSESAIEGTRLIDWVKANAPVPAALVRQIADQMLTILLRRELSGYRQFRGYCNPFIFVIDEGGRVELMDPDDQDNGASLRKMQTKAVMRGFFPPDTGEYNDEQAELYGFARTLQFVMAANENAGSTLPKRERRRWQQLLDNCAGEGMRRIRTFEQAQKALKKIHTGAQTAFGQAQPASREDVPRQCEKQHMQTLPRILIRAAAIVLLVLACKGGIGGVIQVHQQNVTRDAQMSERISELEAEIEILREKQRQAAQDIDISR